MNLTPWRRKSNGCEGTMVARPEDWFADVDRMFDGFLAPWFGEQAAAVPGWTPSMDITEDEHAVTVRAEVPGIDPKELSISIQDGVLTLSGEKKHESEKKGDGWHRRERVFGTFQRAIALPEGVDADQVKAESSHGVLTLTLPKTEKAKPKRIEVKVK